MNKKLTTRQEYDEKTQKEPFVYMILTKTNKNKI